MASFICSGARWRDYRISSAALRTSGWSHNADSEGNVIRRAQSRAQKGHASEQFLPQPLPISSSNHARAKVQCRFAVRSLIPKTLFPRCSTRRSNATSPNPLSARRARRRSRASCMASTSSSGAGTAIGRSANPLAHVRRLLGRSPLARSAVISGGSAAAKFALRYSAIPKPGISAGVWVICCGLLLHQRQQGCRRSQFTNERDRNQFSPTVP